MIFKVPIKPIYSKRNETFQFSKANWESLKHTLDNKIAVNTLDIYTADQVEEKMNKWMCTSKETMQKTIPKSNYKPLYQTSITPQIKRLEKSLQRAKK